MRLKMDCPRCGKEGAKTGKTWKFGLFDVEGYRCAACEKSFNAYYRDGNFSHTVPKPK
jgi:transposase-like protein